MANLVGQNIEQEHGSCTALMTPPFFRFGTELQTPCVIAPSVQGTHSTRVRARR